MDGRRAAGQKYTSWHTAHGSPCPARPAARPRYPAGRRQRHRPHRQRPDAGHRRAPPDARHAARGAKLADLFQVSRTLVRQHSTSWSRDRLVTLTPARGACVAEPSVEEARRVFEVRRMLEAQLARELAAARITPAQLQQLRSHLEEERAAVKRQGRGGHARACWPTSCAAGPAAGQRGAGRALAGAGRAPR